MKTRNCFAMVCVVIELVGCGGLPVKSEYLSNAFSDLGFGISQDQFVDLGPVKGTGRASIILTENTRITLDFQSRWYSQAKNAGGVADSFEMTSLDPNSITSRVALLLKKHFKEVLIAKDYESALLQNSSTIVVLDVKHDIKGVSLIPGDYNANYDIGLYLFSSEGKSLAKVTSSVKGICAGANAFWPCQIKKRDETLSILESNLDKKIK